MAVIYNEIGNAGNIAFMHGHFEAIPAQQAKATEAVTNFIELRNHRYYLKHGAIWPSNDANAQGIVAHDYDITDGSAIISLIVSGNVRTEMLPAKPTAAALVALRNIGLVPVEVVSGGEPVKFMISLPSVSNGSISVADDSSLLVADGGSFEFSVTADSGYHVSAVSANGESLTPDEGIYTIEDIDADQFVSITIEAD
ncbi:MAG: hypothetical protein IJ268_03735 [Proteobacteria bacterium]|nr:hypothetical protein [Pseudomonadota bacterium]MBQ9241701.1 hypothetical protein [Pseudomonadota bacterium]